MPPSPIITVTINEEKLRACCEDLGIHPIPVVRVITRGRQDEFYGHYFPATNAINLYANVDEQMLARSLYVQGQLTRTLLHELRHAWQQQQHGSAWYGENVVKAEQDAESFAAMNTARFPGIVRVMRRYPSSGLSKITRTAQALRQTPSVG